MQKAFPVLDSFITLVFPQGKAVSLFASPPGWDGPTSRSAFFSHFCKDRTISSPSHCLSNENPKHQIPNSKQYLNSKSKWPNYVGNLKFEIWNLFVICNLNFEISKARPWLGSAFSISLNSRISGTWHMSLYGACQCFALTADSRGLNAELRGKINSASSALVLRFLRSARALTGFPRYYPYSDYNMYRTKYEQWAPPL